jgi:CBS domain-containing protein
MPIAREICNQRVVVASANESLGDVARRMLDEGVECVVVVEADGRGRLLPIGIMSEREIVAGMLAEQDRQSGSVPVRDLVQAPLVTAASTDSVECVFERMSEQGVRHVPIIDADGGLEGIITLEDWVEYSMGLLRSLSTLLEREREAEWQEQGRRRAARKIAHPAAPALRLVASSGPRWGGPPARYAGGEREP